MVDDPVDAYTAAMSVFTAVDRPTMEDLLASYRLCLCDYQPAPEGIENTNYFISATDNEGNPRECVLTIFEQLSEPEIPWFINLLTKLAEEALPVPAPLSTATGKLIRIGDKPAILSPRLSGNHPANPSAHQCHTIGFTLARIHQIHYQPATPHAAPEAQLENLVAERLHLLPDSERQQALHVLTQWQIHRCHPVLCHGDLFRDNTLFEGETLTGLLDFYNAGPAPAVLDIAITCNDWCRHADGRLDIQREKLMIEGYGTCQPLSLREQKLLPLAMAVAALRFWLSRLEEKSGTLAGRGSKDPEEFAVIFAQRYAALRGRDAPGH